MRSIRLCEFAGKDRAFQARYAQVPAESHDVVGLVLAQVHARIAALSGQSPPRGPPVLSPPAHPSTRAPPLLPIAGTPLACRPPTAAALLPRRHCNNKNKNTCLARVLRETES